MPSYDSCGIDSNLCCAGIDPTMGFNSGPNRSLDRGRVVLDSVAESPVWRVRYGRADLIK